MNIRVKQKRLYALMKFFVVFGALFIVFYIGAKPTVDDFNPSVSVACSYACDALVVINLVLIFAYYTKYGKCDVVIGNISDETEDCGYYFINSEVMPQEEYISCINNKLCENMFSVKKDFELDELDFSFYADKRKEFVYCSRIDKLSRGDIIAYLDTVINDITYHTLKRQGNGVLLFVTDDAEEGAVSLSKLIVNLGRKNQIRLAIAIAQPQNGKLFFLGNQQTKRQQMIVNYAMLSALPIEDRLKAVDKLDFQAALSEKLNTATVSDLTADIINIH